MAQCRAADASHFDWHSVLRALRYPRTVSHAVVRDVEGCPGKSGAAIRLGSLAGRYADAVPNWLARRSRGTRACAYRRGAGCHRPVAVAAVGGIDCLAVLAAFVCHWCGGGKHLYAIARGLRRALSWRGA